MRGRETRAFEKHEAFFTLQRDSMNFERSVTHGN